MLDISKITDQLFVASRLRSTAVDELKILKIDVVISMIGEEAPDPKFKDANFHVLWLPSYDSFLTPIPMKNLRRGVREALKVLETGGRVLVFCRAGMRRSVTLAASILIASGMESKEAARLIKEKRPIADPGMWYVKWRIKKFERYWKRRS